MRAVLSGLIAALSLVAALHFRRFGKETGDRFFDLFAGAFALFAVNNFAVGVLDPDGSGGAGLYVIRLLAFLVIIVAIWQKNRE